MTSSRPLRRVAGTVLALAAGAAVVLAPPSTAGAAACPTWTTSPVASGYGVLENLGFDGTGGLILSEGNLLGAGGLRRLAADGTRTTVVPGVTSPGGIVVAGDDVYFTSGNGFASGFFNTPDGAINRVDLRTGARSTVATGLVMPNGMVRLPGGDLVVSRDLGNGSMTRVTPAGATSPFAPLATSTNGMAVDAARGLLYVDSTFDLTTVINVVDLAAPDAAPRKIPVPGIGPLNAADDLTLGADGNLYVTLNLAGKVIRVSPGSGAICTVATGIPLVSSVRFGAGPGWDPASLYATSFTGTVTRIRP